MSVGAGDLSGELKFKVRRRQRAYLVFWVAEDDGAVRYALKMAPTGRPDSAVVTFDDGGPQRLTVLRHALPRGPGTALFYRCSWCRKPRRYLYLLDLVRDEAGLRPRSALSGLRTPAVRLTGLLPVGLLAPLRDPSKIPVGPRGRLGPVARGEGVRPPADPDGQRCRARARPSCPCETPTKTTRTAPLEFKDNETGEYFDVV